MSPLAREPEIASYGSRVGAFLLDLLLILPVLLVVAVAVRAQTDSEETQQLATIVAYLVCAMTYPPLTLARKGLHNGQTLGKQWVGIRVLRSDTAPLELPGSLVREVVGKVLLGLIPFFTIVDLLFPLSDRFAQALHDKLANTYVVRAEGTYQLDALPAPAAASDEPMAAWAPPTAD